jgi:hypothetical protein
LKWLLQQRLQSFHPLRKISTVPVLLLLLGGWTTYDSKRLDGLAHFKDVDYNDRKEKILPRNDLKRCFANDKARPLLQIFTRVGPCSTVCYPLSDGGRHPADGPTNATAEESNRVSWRTDYWPPSPSPRRHTDVLHH